MPTVNSELLTSNVVTATITSSGGFEGSVNVTASVVDSNSQPISDWTVTLDSASVSVPSDGTAQAKATVMIPSTLAAASELTATLKIEATDPSGTVTAQSATSAFTTTNQVTIAMNENNGQCQYPAGFSTTTPLQVKVGTAVRWLNMSNGTIEIHSNGAQYGFCHENEPCNESTTNPQATPGTLNTNDAYVQTAATVGDGKAFTWYCHSPGPDLGGQDPAIQVVN